jgi:hypothetical protein cdifQCD-6_20855
MKGYKVFGKDWTCRGFQYAVGETYEMERHPVCCDRGFHFCERLTDCFHYYDFNPENKVAEVEALGKINKEDDKSCTNKIKIVRELTWYEVLNLINMGKGNTGRENTGDKNTGCRNTGDKNTGNWNTGNRNIGNRNTGNWNIGNENTGNWNIGRKNTGNWNIGDWNTGEWNTIDFSTGCFNTLFDNIKLFNKPSNWTYYNWLSSYARAVMCDCPCTKTIWIDSDEMIDSEKEENPTWECTGGYLKTITVTNRDKQAWWDNLDDSDKESVMSLPNFDKDIFKEITGIEV